MACGCDSALRVVAGTVEYAIQRVRTLLEVGFQYVMFFLATGDWESIGAAGAARYPLPMYRQRCPSAGLTSSHAVLV
jgi:hypothetical protein